MLENITAPITHAWINNHMGLLDSIISAESGGNPNATNPRSSAAGLGQFIDGTWLSMLSKYRPDLVEGKSRQEILSLKTDPALSREMTQKYADENTALLKGAGFDASPGNTYLAHFAGPAGARSVLGANPATPVANLLTPGAIAANPFLKGMTAGDLVAWAGRKVGSGGAPRIPVTASAQAPQAAPSPYQAPSPQAQTAELPPMFGAAPRPQIAAVPVPVQQHQPQNYFDLLAATLAEGQRVKPIKFAGLPARRGFY